MLVSEWREIHWPGMIALSAGVLSAMILLQAFFTLLVLLFVTWVHSPSPFAFLGQVLALPFVLVPLVVSARLITWGIIAQIRKHREIHKPD